MSNRDTSPRESGSSQGEVFVDHAEHLKRLLGEEYDQAEAAAFRETAFARLITKSRVRLEALSFDDDPLDGVDSTAKAMRFGRVGAAPGEPRTKFQLRTIAASIYGHTPPFMPVASEAAPAPEGADETAVDPEWDASVRA